MTRIPEAKLLKPVLRLFPCRAYIHLEQVPLGRKKIDLVCLDRRAAIGTSVELKVADWRRAVWQAAINFQVTEFSYIALWHEFVHRAVSEIELLKHYGVGLIGVDRSRAEILLRSARKAHTVGRDRKRQWYEQLLEQAQEVLHGRRL